MSSLRPGEKRNNGLSSTSDSVVCLTQGQVGMYNPLLCVQRREREGDSWTKPLVTVALLAFEMETLIGGKKMELFNGAERMHSVRGGDAGALGSPQLLLLSGPPLIVGNSRGSSLMSRSSSSMITHEISLMFPSSRRLLFGGVRHGDNHLLSMVPGHYSL